CNTFLSFFFTDTPTTEIYTLSLHDALPIFQHSPLFANVSPADCREIVSAARESEFPRRDTIFLEGDPIRQVVLLTSGSVKVMLRSEEHTSELQSPCNLVCRLLLEKKKNELI